MAAFTAVAAASPPLSLLHPPQPHRHPSDTLSFSNTKPLRRSSAASIRQFVLSPPLSSSPPTLISPDYSSPPPEPSPSSLDGCLELLRLAVRYSDAELAQTVHCLVLKLDPETRVFNAVISSYLKLGLIRDACRVFKALSQPNVVSYTALMSGLAKSGRELDAMRLFFKMRSSGIEPNEFTFVAILTACMRIFELELGSQIHAMAFKSGFLDSVFVANSFMGLYRECKRPDCISQLFDEMPVRDVSSWNVIISSLVKESMHGRAMVLFREMHRIGNFEVDHITLSTLLASCANSFDLPGGGQIHACSIKTGLQGSLNVSNALIAFYTKCGNVDEIKALYNTMAFRDVITWTEMITGFMEFGLVDMALEVYDKMPEKNSISHAAVLAGLCQNGEAARAVELFIGMVEERTQLTEHALTTVVKACGLLADVDISKQIQGFITKYGVVENPHIEAALLDMCVRCGRTEDAEEMFYLWPYEEDSSVVYTSMVCGHARNGNPDEAISLFCRGWSEEKMEMDEVASTSALGVCGTLGFREMGVQIHCHTIKSGIIADIEVSNGLVSMYSKCWNLEESLQVFREMPARDITSWNCLLSAHILHRLGDRALHLWSEMNDASVKPDEITFVQVISAYQHTKACLVNECRELFMSMRKHHNIEPSVEHYKSLIEVLSFWGNLEDAERIVSSMPFKPEARIWRALLDGCRIHSDTAREKWVVKQLLSMEPHDPSSYALISNLYSASGRWHLAETVREEMREKGFRKHPARSWVIHENRIIPFYTRDESHPQSKDIHRGLEILILECLKAGYEPDSSFALQEVEEYQKKHFLFYHSAKLAAAFGLLMTKPGKPVKIVKNILLCGDCHSFLKYASAVTNRQILLRDSSGFHEFSNRRCSCSDDR